MIKTYLLKKVLKCSSGVFQCRSRRKTLLRSCAGTRELCVRNYLVPVFWLGKRYDTRAVHHFLIRPEGPSDLVSFEQRHKQFDPFVVGLAGFAKPDRDIVLVPKIDILLDCCPGGCRPIFVKLIQYVL